MDVFTACPPTTRTQLNLIVTSNFFYLGLQKMLNIKKRGLGKGLNDLGISELLSDLNTTANNSSDTSNLQQLPIEQVRSGKYQPRKKFNTESLQELADSIKSQGVIQPIVVRLIENNDYEIIAGERRWRAAQLAGLHQIPVVIRNVPDEAAIAMALIENIQREDLNVIEEANALQRLTQEFALTHEQVAEIVGKSRATITNILRLLSLNNEVKNLLINKELEMGHARALLSLPIGQQADVAKTVIIKKLSVRDTEKLIQRLQTSSVKKAKSIDPDIARLEKNLSDKLAAAVTIQHATKGKGKLIIHYNSLDELDGILKHIN
jgi:ParB family chromosome partitioning protein